MTTQHSYTYNIEALVAFLLFRSNYSEKPHEYLLSRFIEACEHLGGLKILNQAFVLLIDFATLAFTIYPMNQIVNTLL
jgi:hypothetical protein